MAPKIVARIRTNRSDYEYLAKDRQDIIDTFDALRLDRGDVIELTMMVIDDSELVGLPDGTPEAIAAIEGYQLQIEG